MEFPWKVLPCMVNIDFIKKNHKTTPFPIIDFPKTTGVDNVDEAVSLLKDISKSLKKFDKMPTFSEIICPVVRR